MRKHSRTKGAKSRKGATRRSKGAKSRKGATRRSKGAKSRKGAKRTMRGGALPDYIGPKALIVRRPLEQDYLAPPTFFTKEEAEKDIEDAQGMAYI